jgi:2-dehydro-3-deoxyphosphogluconate aldolase/(4S)-4-hydroxy-2-oxoglutarate aldolase
MQKIQVLNGLVQSGAIAVIRTDSTDRAAQLVEAVWQGGITAIEVTMSVPGALGLLADLSHRYGDKVLLGAGTVLDPETARQAILSGAQYIISPHLNVKTIALCQRYQVAALPGCQTVTEAMTALEAGADMVKLFPAEVLGLKYLKAVRAALPQVPFVPTGGIGPDNAAEWIRAGAVAVGIGGELTRGGSLESVTEVSRRMVAAVRAARGE